MDFQMAREASRVKWAPKASQETQASLHSTPARQALMEGQDSKDSQGLLDHRDQTVRGRNRIRTEQPGPCQRFIGFFC